MPERVALSLTIQVDDAERLKEYARERYEACWGHLEEWEPDDVAEAVMEALVLSNENPSPADYGIQIVFHNAWEVEAREASPQRGRRDDAKRQRSTKRNPDDPRRAE